MTGPEIAEFIKENYNKDGHNTYNYRSKTYELLGIRFRTIVWKVIDQMIDLGLVNNIQKSYRKITCITLQKTTVKISIRSTLDRIDKWVDITIPLYAFIEEGVGPKIKNHLINLKLNRLKKRREELLLEFGKVDMEIEDLQRKL